MSEVTTLIRPDARPTRARESDVVGAEFARAHWDHTPEHGVRFDDLLEPAYWANVAKRLNFNGKGRGGIIQVVAADYSYAGRLLVVDVGHLSARVRKLDYTSFDGPVEQAPKATDGYEVKWAGNNYKWRVIRKLDNEPIQSGLPDEFAARDWLTNYLKAQAA